MPPDCSNYQTILSGPALTEAAIVDTIIMHEITGVPHNLPSEDTNSSDLLCNGGMIEHTNPLATTAFNSSMLCNGTKAHTTRELGHSEDFTRRNEISPSEMTTIATVVELQNRSLSVQRDDLAQDQKETNVNTANAGRNERGIKSALPTEQAGESQEHQSILTLPIDSLHWLASFLTPSEWSNFGECNKTSNRICREIFKRVRMHGLRCAAEVVTAWAVRQYSDAKELCALYIRAGVPIYPFSLGHSYHTLLWRMSLETKELQNKTDAQTISINGTEEYPPQFDRFFVERSDFRSRRRSQVQHSYLEEKALHTLTTETEETDPVGTQIFRRQLSMNMHNTTSRIRDIVSLESNASVGRPTPSAFHPSYRTLKRSNSQSNFGRQTPKVKLPVHRHLLDQHLLGRKSVDDSDGTMTAPMMSLSADFFHPHFSFRPVSGMEESQAKGNPRRSPPQPALLTENLLPAWHGNRGDFYEGELESEDSDGPLVRHIEIVGEAPVDQVQDDEESNRNLPISSESSVILPLMPQVCNDILSSVDLEVYSANSLFRKEENKLYAEARGRIKYLCSKHQKRLERQMSKKGFHDFDECMLDFWDEVFTLTAGFHYYDRHTAVPRLSSLQKFLATPCPKEIGIVQCEIERIKIPSKKKGVDMKGRFFPTYEYRLFIRHRPRVDSEGPRRDTILMTARIRGRRESDLSGPQILNKKGSNNYFICLPSTEDCERHYRDVNGKDSPRHTTINGAGAFVETVPRNLLLGRLQSNFIGTEFQIFTPRSDRIDLSNQQWPHIHSSMTSIENAKSMSTQSLKRKKSFRRCLSMRRDSSQDGRDRSASGIDDCLNRQDLARHTLRRSCSSGELKYRYIRSNRRAIANTNEAFSLQPLEDEAGAITYTANLLGSRPRIMDVCIPKVRDPRPSENQGSSVFGNVDQPVGGLRMIDRLKQMQQRTDNTEGQQQPSQLEQTTRTEDRHVLPNDFALLALQNRPPWWNVELGSFVLNFGGRVSVASVKNFQLCDRNDQDYIMLQFGRIQGRHSFTMDFQYPLTAVQAFAIAISSLQSKISFG